MLSHTLLALATTVSGMLGAPHTDAPPVQTALASIVTAAVAEPQACPSYWVAADDGGVFTAGAAPFAGAGVGKLGAPVVALAGTPTGKGYWLTASSGRVAAFGDARSFGSASTKGVVGMAARPDGAGYWLATGDGRVLGFGAARAVGSLAGRRLTKPVVGIAPTPSGAGYWLATGDGGVFAFGDARFLGSAAKPGRNVVALAASPTGRGYWLASADGGVFSFGDARFHGAATGTLPRPVTAIAASPTGGGYWLASADGRVVAFGDARAAAPVRYPTDASRVVAIAPPAVPLPCPAAAVGRKVVFLGDSVMFDVAAGLEPALKLVPGTVVASRPWFAYGLDLSRDKYDWRKEWPKILAEEQPDVVVVLAGYGDMWPKADAPADQRPETPQWRARYGRVVDDVDTVLTAGGAKVVWIGLPWVADTNIYFPNVRARVASANEVYKAAVAKVGGVFVDAASLLAGPDGGYAFTVLDGAKVVQLRKPDGLHLCPPGVVRLAQAAGAEVTRTFGDALRPGWETGAWRNDVRFHQGPSLDCKL